MKDSSTSVRLRDLPPFNLPATVPRGLLWCDMPNDVPCNDLDACTTHCSGSARSGWRVVRKDAAAARPAICIALEVDGRADLALDPKYLEEPWQRGNTLRGRTHLSLHSHDGLLLNVVHDVGVACWTLENPKADLRVGAGKNPEIFLEDHVVSCYCFPSSTSSLDTCQHMFQNSCLL